YARMAKDVRHPRAYQVHFAALAWANRIGHATFGPGELAQVLGIGHGRQANNALSKAIATAKGLGLVAPESGVNCLVLPSTMFQKGGQGTGSCKIHGAYASL